MFIINLLLLSLAINIVFFVVAYKLKTDKFTDGTYALTFFSLAAFSLLGNRHPSVLSIVAFVMVSLWAVRIGVFLVRRIRKVGKDSRFDEMRGSLLKFGKFWLGQAITSWVVMIPAALAINNGGSWQMVNWLGISMWAIGLKTETLADWQKNKFRNNPNNKNRWIETGLWKYSRHPNYFGEMLVWSGLYIFALPSLNGMAKIAAAISPLFIIGIIMFVTGVPILEKTADEKWGDDPKYQSYKKRTSVLVPLPNFRDKK